MSGTVPPPRVAHRDGKPDNIVIVVEAPYDGFEAFDLSQADLDEEEDGAWGTTT